VITEPIEALARIQEASFARASESTRRAYPTDKRMTGEEMLEFLARRKVGVLATVRPDGRPQAGLAGYALVGARFVFASREDAGRVRNVRHHPHVSLVVGEETADGRSVVVVEGTARLQSPNEASLETRAPFRDDHGTLPEWIEVLLLLTPERILSYGSDRG